MLQRDVGDRIFNDNAGAWFSHWNSAPRAAIHFFGAKHILRHFITPITKRAFGELHDVALVHQGYTFAVVANGVADRAVNQTHATRIAHWFDPNAYTNLGGKIFCSDGTPKLLSFFLRAETNLLEFFGKFLG